MQKYPTLLVGTDGQVQLDGLGRWLNDNGEGFLQSQAAHTEAVGRITDTPCPGLLHSAWVGYAERSVFEANLLSVIEPEEAKPATKLTSQRG